MRSLPMITGVPHGSASHDENGVRDCRDPGYAARQIAGSEAYLEVGRQLRKDNIRGIVTCACGTSDHAATFFKYLMETQTGLPVASIGPSVALVYGTQLRLEDFACVSFSQSGGSPDLAALQQAAKQGGAHCRSERDRQPRRQRGRQCPAGFRGAGERGCGHQVICRHALCTSRLSQRNALLLCSAERGCAKTVVFERPHR